MYMYIIFMYMALYIFSVPMLPLAQSVSHVYITIDANSLTVVLNLC